MPLEELTLENTDEPKTFPNLCFHKYIFVRANLEVLILYTYVHPKRIEINVV